MNRETFGHLLDSDRQELSFRLSDTSEASSGMPPLSEASDNSSSYNSIVWDQDPSPYALSNTPSWGTSASSPLSRSPWSLEFCNNNTSLIGSLVREKGHIYSLAASGDLLYTGSDSKNIRVWKQHKEFTGFKTGSGLVKAIVIAGGRIFTGHQDGKIRVWKVKKQGVHKKIGTLPTLKAKVKKSFNPSNYVEVRKNQTAIWIKHVDAISCLSLSEDKTLLYSGSWDRRIKVWRLSDSKCLESINAHDDAVNSVVAGFDGLVFTGSADGTVKVWRRELQGKGTKHFFSQTLIKQENAITSLVVDLATKVLYCGSSDGLVNYWEHTTFLFHGGVLRGHKLAVLCLAISGNMVFSGSADGTICVWRREGGDHVCISVLSGHNGPVKCLAVEKGRDDEYTVYSGSLDKSVKIWRVFGQMEVVRTPPSHRSSNRYSRAESFSGHSNELRTDVQTPPSRRSSIKYNRFESFSRHSTELQPDVVQTPPSHRSRNQYNQVERFSRHSNELQPELIQTPPSHRSRNQYNRVESFSGHSNELQTDVVQTPPSHRSRNQCNRVDSFSGHSNELQTRQSPPMQQHNHMEKQNQRGVNKMSRRTRY